MPGFNATVKQKTPSKRFSWTGLGIVWLRKLVWGRTTVYLQLFGVNISSGLPTSNYKLDLVFVISSSDWTLLPHHREFAYLSPLTTDLVQSPTGRIISPSKVFLVQRNHESRRITSAQSQTFSPYIGFGMVELKIKMLKINLFYLFEFGSQFWLCNNSVSYTHLTLPTKA